MLKLQSVETRLELLESRRVAGDYLYAVSPLPISSAMEAFLDSSFRCIFRDNFARAKFTKIKPHKIMARGGPSLTRGGYGVWGPELR